MLYLVFGIERYVKKLMVSIEFVKTTFLILILVLEVLHGVSKVHLLMV